MSLFQILDCQGAMGTVTKAVDVVLNIIRWAIPVVLIILGSIDMFKAMASGDDKEAEKGKKTFIRRLVYAVVAFLIPFLITLVFDVVGKIVTDNQEIKDVNNADGDFFSCWYQKKI